MLIEKRCLQNDECVFMEFRDVNKDYLEWLEDLALEYHCKIEKRSGARNTTTTWFTTMSLFVLTVLK